MNDFDNKFNIPQIIIKYDNAIYIFTKSFITDILKIEIIVHLDFVFDQFVHKSLPKTIKCCKIQNHHAQL